jgi:hypothetical protein
MNLPAFPEKEPNYNLNFQSSVVVNLSAPKFDLAGWLPNFTCEQYVACTPSSKSHKYSHIYRDGDGELVYRNDEWVGGFMMTQFYRERIMKLDNVRLVSLTRARLLEVIPLVFPLYWEMKVEPYQGESDRSLFTCLIGIKLDPLYFIGGQITQLLFWAQAHADEETPHFANFAALWATRNDSEQQKNYIK